MDPRLQAVFHLSVAAEGYTISSNWLLKPCWLLHSYKVSRHSVAGVLYASIGAGSRPTSSSIPDRRHGSTIEVSKVSVARTDGPWRPHLRRHSDQNRLRRRGIQLIVLQRDARRLDCAGDDFHPIHQSTHPPAVGAARSAGTARWKVFLRAGSFPPPAAAQPTDHLPRRKLRSSVVIFTCVEASE